MWVWGEADRLDDVNARQKKIRKKNLSLLPLKQEHKSLGKHLLDRMYASEH